MPSIRQNPEQQKALEDITTALAELKSMNILSDGEWANSVTLSFSNGGTGRGSTLKVQIDANAKEDEKDIAAILRVLQGRRARIAKDALARAEKFDIRLDEEEEATLRGELPQKKSRKKNVSEAPDATAAASEQTNTNEETTEQSPAGFTGVGENATQEEVPQNGPVQAPAAQAEAFDADAFASDDDHAASEGDEDAELEKALGQFGSI